MTDKQEELSLARKFYYTLFGQSLLLSILTAILLTENLESLQDLKPFPGLILIFLLFKLYAFILKIVNYKAHMHYTKIIVESLNDDGID